MAAKAKKYLADQTKPFSGDAEFLQKAREQFDAKLLTYEMSDDHVEITGYKGGTWVYIVFPSQIDGKPVTVIRGSAWGKASSGNSSSAAKNAGREADSEEEEMTAKGSALGSGGASGTSDFSGSGTEGFGWDHLGLVGVDIPDSVTRFGDGAFRDCCFLLTAKLPDSINSIGANAFSGCHCLKDLAIPEKCASIGDYAFDGCSAISAFTIPEDTLEIGTGAFPGCKGLTDLSVSEYNSAFDSDGGVLFDASGNRLIAYPAGKVAISYEIPRSVDSIADCAFAKSQYLEAVGIPDTVSRIGMGAFADCRSLKEIVFPAQLSLADYMLCYNCAELESISFYKGLSCVESGAFDGCAKLKDVYYEGSEDEWNGIAVSYGENDNLPLQKAVLHFNSRLPGTAPLPEASPTDLQNARQTSLPTAIPTQAPAEQETEEQEPAGSSTRQR